MATLPQKSESKQLPATRGVPTRSLSLVVAGGGLVSLFVFGLGVFPLLALIGGLVVFAAASLVRKSLEATGEQPLEADRLKTLKRHILKSRYLENVGDLGERVAEQMDLSSERFEKLKALLGLKFDYTELTYARYLGAAEAAFLTVLDNLHLAAISLTALDVRDSSADAERLGLRQQQLAKVRQLLTLNERAITELERVSAALSEVKTKRGESSHSLDALMAELSELAKRAKLYSVESLDANGDDKGSSGEKK